MLPLSPKLESLFVIIDDYVGLTHRDLIDKIPPAWYLTNNPKKELTNALDRLKKAGRIVGKHDEDVYVYQSIKPAESPESEPMNTVGEFLDRTLADVARDFLAKESVESESVIAVTTEQKYVPENAPPALPDDIETLTVYRVRGTNKCFETVDEVMGYRAALNRKRQIQRVADMWPNKALSTDTVEKVAEFMQACGWTLIIPEIAP